MNKERITLRPLDRVSAPWQADQRLRIGRLPKNDVVLDDSSVSRSHAEIVRTGSGWVLHDLGSSNGTYLNGSRVGRAEVPLQQGDIIQIGDTGLVVDAIRSDAVSVAKKPDAGMEVVDALSTSWEEIRGAGETTLPARFASLAMIGRAFNDLDSLDAFLENVLWAAAEVFEAEYGAIALRDDKSPHLRVRAIFALGDRTRPDACADPALAEWAFGQQQTILCQPALPGERAGPRLLSGFLRCQHNQLGVVLLGRGAELPPFDKDDLAGAEFFSHCLSSSIESLDKQLARQHGLILQTLTTLSHLLQLRNSCSTAYSDGVTEYALLIANRLQLSDQDKHFLKMGAPLRDIGKIALPDALFEKPEKLTPQEIFYVRSHVATGVALLESIPFLVPLVPMVRSHHEHWDGSGYPDGIADEQIPVLSRIIAVADALDAMTSSRPFRAPLSLEDALGEIEQRAGTQFDPRCVEALLDARAEIQEYLRERSMGPVTYCMSEALAAGAGYRAGRAHGDEPRTTRTVSASLRGAS